MPEKIPDNSVGLVSEKTFRMDQPLPLRSGQTLPSYQLVYETYGQLNDEASNAVLICHALSSDQHAAGYRSMDDKNPGWWDNAIGPGKPIDTDRFFVVCPNNLGGCSGSTGPTSINPETQEAYGASFPMVTVSDWVKTQAALADSLGISVWAAVVGGSLGGMQAMQWAIAFPERLRHSVIIASAPYLTAQNIAFNEVARQAITSDPAFYDGQYQEQERTPETGLKLARMLGHITYLSDESMGTKFGRKQRHDEIQYHYDIEFEVESYLRHQGQSFVNRFDANTYLLMTKALDYFDPASEFDNDLSQAFAKVSAKFLVLSFTSDWRFSPQRSEEIVQALITAGKDVSYAEIVANHGHDAFLMAIDDYFMLLGSYMKKIDQNIAQAKGDANAR